MRKLRLALVIAAVGALGIVGATTASNPPNDNGDPTYVAGNPVCPEGSTFYTLKIEDEYLAVGTYGAIDITAYDGKYVSWRINAAYLNVYDADLVIVKGGPNALIYHYDSWDDWDTGLTAPWNPNSGKWYGISHIQFCFDPKA